jgi:hypothetical protein
MCNTTHVWHGTQVYHLYRSKRVGTIPSWHVSKICDARHVWHGTHVHQSGVFLRLSTHIIISPSASYSYGNVAKLFSRCRQCKDCLVCRYSEVSSCDCTGVGIIITHGDGPKCRSFSFCVHPMAVVHFHFFFFCEMYANQHTTFLYVIVVGGRSRRQLVMPKECNIGVRIRICGEYIFIIILAWVFFFSNTRGLRFVGMLFRLIYKPLL